MYTRHELNIKPNDIVISYIAELNKNKNHIFLLRNWNNLIERCPNVHCLIVGKGENEQNLIAYVKKNNLKNVHFLGYRRDIPKILFQSDIVALLSYREGLPRCLMEGMAARKPLVVTNIRGSRDLVKHGENGFVVDLDDDQALVECFTKLVQDKDLREKMGRNSLEKIQDYKLENALEELKQIYSNYITRVD